MHEILYPFFDRVIMDMYVLMRDAERRKKEASKVKQTTKQSNTTHPRQSLFHRYIELSQVGSEPVYMYMYMNTFYTVLTKMTN